MTTPYETLEVAEDGGVCFITISNPPVNVMTLPLYQDLVRVTEEVEHNESIKVVVFQSADPEFFIAHFDVEMILTFPTDPDQCAVGVAFFSF